ncbi:hypothetical protein [Xylella fastidiosa]|uniref:Uncharacterized protein n=1 Tax=Xylella fastidiosa (strain Temecula1 / ATCC 700964) TaxID=183190 RepID=Q87A06_XYLFT|nr:hypothetical protein [Xylella fastidiosa]AAO29857.1 conserved hypothetical protein [Xylella fastidiosa Temecula1]WCF23828.1 hypothetical protein OK113_10705 [Xylella fastidiosa subsp. fastidiosa]
MGWNSRSLDGVKHSIKTLNNARQADAYSAGSTLAPTIHGNNTLCAQYGTHWDFDTITDLGCLQTPRTSPTGLLCLDGRNLPQYAELTL